MYNSNAPQPPWSPPPIQAPKPQHPVSPHRVGAASPANTYAGGPTYAGSSQGYAGNAQSYASAPQSNYGAYPQQPSTDAGYGSGPGFASGNIPFGGGKGFRGPTPTPSYPMSQEPGYGQTHAQANVHMAVPMNRGGMDFHGGANSGMGSSHTHQMGGGANFGAGLGTGEAGAFGAMGGMGASGGQMGGQAHQGFGGMGSASGQIGQGPQGFYAPGFINEFQGSATAQLGMQLGQRAFTQVQENVNQNLNRWVNIAQLKYYFNVSNSYVLHKIATLLFPFRHQPWSRLVRRSEQSGQMEGYKPPREDLNAPDLYIPVMSFVTYILVVGIQLGLQSTSTGNSDAANSKDAKVFSPDVLAGTGTTAFFVIFSEVVFIKLGCYLLNVVNDASFLDLIAYCGYKFIGILVTYIAKIFLPQWAVYVVFAYAMICFGFFTLRSLKYLVLPALPEASYPGVNAINPESYPPVGTPMRKRRINFLFLVAGVQILLAWLLI